ncbi:hypothetical protein BCR34DRAFT_627168 [Clohesyomyces aquaticus]|uniref:PWWP domain-containing protein n=1 Tax=Clohesyomyces aquaticus TaxID=1231657 RepID=A0A1Y1Z165_9PLEO|nr:hypothetical protein BCR34DRAFT_627168 [Clohesyomyces aquaticus]
MADDANASATVDPVKAVDEATRSADAQDDSANVDTQPAEGGGEGKAGESVEGSEPATSKPDDAADETMVTDTGADTTMATDTSAMDGVANGTPASKKANGKRKSGAGIPEHKKKTPSKKKKSSPELHLDARPGSFWFVSMKGYPPWPVVVCDEEMLPETLLSKRPVSAQRLDGTWREDHMIGAKNAKDRRFPVMFLGTNEFSWQVNSDLQTLNADDVKEEVEKGNSGKKSKALWEAYEICADQPDLQTFKTMLNTHEEALQADAEEKAAADAKKLEKKDKSKRKSVAAEESEDVDMDNAGDDGAPSAKKAKASKKRKKDPESDGENDKPAKTPKSTQKIKLKNTAPKEESAAKPKKESKAKKSKAKSDSEDTEAAKVEEEKPLTPAERLEKREKSVLYLRHRLQKGFLSRDQAPKEEEMDHMSEYLKQLEAYKDLEGDVIKNTKVHKVLKAIIKLPSIPKEGEHQFKKRSNDLLSSWSGQLSGGDAPAEPATNGIKHDEAEKADAAIATTEKSEETPAEPSAVKATDGDGDVSMADAKNEAPAAEADAGSSAEAAAEEVSAA